MTALVELVVEEPAWLGVLPDLADLAETAARRALAGAGIAPEGWQISVLACDDARIAALNGDFRGRPQPTNVLSWPTFDLAPARPGAIPPPPPPGPGPLGDVAIALQTCQSEAETAGLPLKNHCIHLILHGCLHLIGYDHLTDADADVMENIERRALAALFIADPYL